MAAHAANPIGQADLRDFVQGGRSRSTERLSLWMGFKAVIPGVMDCGAVPPMLLCRGLCCHC